MSFSAVDLAAPSSSVRATATIFFVFVSMISPVDEIATLPSMLNVTQPGCSRSLTLAICLGGVTVLSKTCSRLLAASQTQISFSSGVRPMPWLGQPWRLGADPCLNPLHFDTVKLLAGLDVADLQGPASH